MLNISLSRINEKVFTKKYNSFKFLGKKKHSQALIKIIVIFGVTAVMFMFVPWTQNIRSQGYVTTLYPDQKPQTIQSLLSGKIEEWYITEGQIVVTGDTILRLSEVKEEYLDPDLINNTSNQIIAKEESSNSYNEKARNLELQFEALENSREIKLTQNENKINQVRLKIKSDSMDLQAIRLKNQIAKKQLDRIESLYNDGIKSLTDLETKRMSFQESQAKVISIENIINSNKNELENLYANRNAIKNDYADKIAKSRSELYSALSAKYDTDANVNKLQSSLNRYSERRKNYYVIAPVDGMVTNTMQSGIGEIIKNGDVIVNIIPQDIDLAVETYVLPQDLPLLDVGEDVRIQFDGWPAVVFSGWPDNSFGTFGGKIVAIDQNISPNGKYRILIGQDDTTQPWPNELRIGGGANTITLLENVKLGYEIWRRLNGFPPDYYSESEADSEKLKSKAPLKKVK